jgi:hypothetical protein
MYILKGFFTHDSLKLNQLNKVALFGELSENSKSYAKDKLEYSNGTQTSLVVFHTFKDSVRIEVPVTVGNNALAIGSWILARALAGQIGADAFTLRQQLNAEFATKSTGFQTGAVLLDVGGMRMPEWISYTDITTAEPTTVTVWLSDESFANQYDEFSIEVVAPILPLNDFFKDPLVVKQKLAAYDLVTKTDEVQAKRGEYPFTMIKTFRYDYNNPANLSDKTPSYWTVIIYGQAGNNPDLIREAIVKEVLANSTHTQTEWAVILPDLFRTTEFIFTPFWTSYSIPNHEFQAGIYSPTVDPRERNALIKRTARGSGYTAVYVDNRYELTANIYKSLAMAVLGNPDNRDGVTQFSDKWPQYMIATNNTPDFNRMDPDTAEFSNLLSRLIVAAETMTMFTSVPVGLSRILRDGIVYASGYYKNINYLVVAKPTVESL